MIYKSKENEAECRQRHRLFWRNSSTGVPLVYAAAKNKHFTAVPWVSPLPRKAWDLLPEWHLNQIENFLEGTLFLGDAMPMASLMVGLDITNTAVLAGGEYDFSSTGESLAFQPGSFDLFRPVPEFSQNHSLVEALKRCYQAVFSVVGNRAYVNTPMTLDALSSLYGIRGSTTLLRDLIIHKEHVRERVWEMTTSYLAFYDYFYAYLKEHGYGESASWFQVFCEGKFESVRCDFSLMLSREMFCEFVVPELQQVCNHMDHSLFNMCSVQHARFIDDLAAIPSLDGIFWNPEPYLDGIKGYLPVLKKIKAQGLLLEIVCRREEEAILAVRELGPDGLYLFFEPHFASADEARYCLDRIYAASR